MRMFATVHECFGFCEAFRVKGFLEARGFFVEVPDQITADEKPALFYTDRPVRVQVEETQLFDARMALEDFPPT
jgi:hypothetical protein